MNKLPRLVAHTGLETTQEELDIIRSTFSDSFDTEVAATIFRGSESDLPLTIQIFVQGMVGSAAYDLLKIGVKALLGNRRLKRRPTIVYRQAEATYIFSEKKVLMQKQSSETEFASVDDLFEYLKSR
jgi:hypothetical protein